MYRCPNCHQRVAGSGPCPRDGAPRPEGSVDPGHEGDDFALAGITRGEPLGAGGFAVVWAARREQDGAPVAVKVGRRSSPLVEQRFRAEAAALERIGPPFVPALYAHGRLEDGRPYLVLERLGGATLAALLAARAAPFTPAEAGRIGDAVLAALAAAHAAGVVHRDLKPENVFLDAPPDHPSLRAVLVDFGLVRALDATGRGPTETGTIVGTPEYMAPEQIRGDRVIDARADLYAFGVVLYELLTLRPPFVGEAKVVEYGHLSRRPPRLGALARTALEDRVLACLAKDPYRRPESAEALRRSLAEAAAAAPRDMAMERGSAAEDTGQRLLAEGRRPVALLAVEIDRADTPVIPAVTGRGGLVARQRGRRYVAVFSGANVDDPLRAALAAARALTGDHGARAALHLARVAVRWKDGGGLSVFGAPVDRPETWMPKEPWSGLATSDAFARAMPPDATLPSSEGPESAGADVPVITEAPLVGREAERDAIAASMAEVFADGRPGLYTLLGDDGTGKSRLARFAADLARSSARCIAITTTREAPVTPALAAEVLSAPAPAGAGDASGAPHGLTRALAAGLCRLAGEGPVAVVLDGAHWAEDTVLDAVEYATLSGERRPLWVLVTAHPRFEQLRPRWGSRAQRGWKATLAPLDARASADLAAALLRPAEYPPADVLARLAAWSGGNPLSLSEIVAAVKRAGVVRRRAYGASFYVATAELDRIAPSLVGWQWIAARELDALSPALAAFARFAAVLGAELDRDEVEAAEDALERAGAASAPVDAGFGLEALAGAGILRRAGAGRYVFRSAPLHEAIYALLEPTGRDAIHRAVLAHLRAAPGAARIAAIARHAAASGALREAVEAHLSLGDRAAAQHRHVEADQHYTAALALVEDAGARHRALALAGRGKSRLHVWRPGEAARDLDDAIAIARALADRELFARVLLDRATLRDWQGKFDASARDVDEARAALGGEAPPSLHARLLVAEGRTAHRRATDLGRGSLDEAIAILEAGVAAAEAEGDHEARTVGLLLLAYDLVRAGHIADAEARFDEVIAWTRATGDRVHLSVAYWNRVRLWTARERPAEAIDDLRCAADLAREIGHPWIEYHTTFNVALLLHWGARTAEALPLARRVRLLEERFAEEPTARGALLLARVLFVSGPSDEARRLVDWVAATCPPARRDFSDYTDFQLTRWIAAELSSGDPPPEATWTSLLALATEGEGALPAEELLELLFWRARTALLRGRLREADEALARAGPLLRGCPLWAPHFEAIARLRAAPEGGTASA